MVRAPGASRPSAATLACWDGWRVVDDRTLFGQRIQMASHGRRREPEALTEGRGGHRPIGRDGLQHPFAGPSVLDKHNTIVA